MRFAALQKNSFIDYPKKIAALVFTQGCNFSCPYCHNPSLIKTNSKEYIDEKEVLAFLEKSKTFLDALAITGGEPTLHKSLLDFLIKVKEMGYLIKIDTNGSNPDFVKKIADLKLVDYIAMDIKAIPQHYVKYFNAPQDIAEKIVKTIDFIMKSNIDYEFRTTCVKPFISIETVPKIAPLLENAKRWFFQKCTNIENSLMPLFLSEEGKILNEDEIKEIVAYANNFVQYVKLR